MIQFLEDTQSSYKNRTIINAQSSDATIAFALNFSTPGEILTRMATEKSGKTYIPVSLEPLWIDSHFDSILKILHSRGCHSLNIAGNGISRLKVYGITQEVCDNMIYDFLKKITEHIEIQSIRSGGQTGADESGLKAAERLGIPEVICLCPKGWRFWDSGGDHIGDEKLFKSRFYG